MTDAELTADQPPARPVGRRTVLRNAAALGGVAVVAACGGSTDTPAGSGATSSAPTGGGSSPTGGGGGGGGGGTGGGGTVLGPAADVAVGSGTIYQEEQVVVTQPTKGDFKAFSSICTHAGCPVADVTDTINCDCHGSMYSIEDGSVVGGPAPSPLPPKQITLDGSDLVVS